MQTQADPGQLVGLGLVISFFLVFIAIAVLAMRKARRRRAAELRESSAEELESRADAARLAERQGAEAAPAAADTEVEAERDEGAEHERATVDEPERVSPEPAEAMRPVEPAAPGDAALERGLARTSSSLRERLGQIFGRHPKIDPAVLDELEEALLTADVGVSMTTRLIAAVKGDLEAKRLRSGDEVQKALREHMLSALADGAKAPDPFAASGTKPRVILFVGVNGVGKTTTIGKVAALAAQRGQKVVLAAGDTFRAAATEQLAIWAERTDSHIVRGEAGADPASVVFKAIEHAQKTSADLVLCDTAGRLHTKTQLMDEIKKVKRSAAKARAGAPDEVWLVVDATTGQNALVQAREFHQVLGLTGVILTKLDGTAKGGVVVAIADALKVPVRFVGVGESAEDLRPFAAPAFVNALFA